MDIYIECKGRWESILINLGIDPKHFNGKHQACIFDHGKDCSRWAKINEFYFCNRCGHKQPMNLAMEFLGLGFKETCAEIRKIIGSTNEVKQQKKPTAIPRLKQIHSKLKRIQEGDLVSQYLQSRGIKTLPKKDVFTGHELPYYGPDYIKGTLTAMVSRITDIKGSLESFHLTYLNNDAKKITNAQSKIVVSPVNTITGGSVKLSDAGEHLCVAEGIETALMVEQEEGVTCWSGVNANGVSSLVVPDHVTMVSIFLDNDASFTGHAVSYALARRLKAKKIRVNIICDWPVGMDYLDWINSQ